MGLVSARSGSRYCRGLSFACSLSNRGAAWTKGSTKLWEGGYRGIRMGGSGEECGGVSIGKASVGTSAVESVGATLKLITTVCRWSFLPGYQSHVTKVGQDSLRIEMLSPSSG